MATTETTTRWEFRLDSIAELIKLGELVGAPVELIPDVSILSQPVSAGSLRIPNSLAVQPMEGCDGEPDGRPGKLTARRYERFAGGGAGLVWMEAIAVVPEGRANPRQLWMNADSKFAFAEMVRLMRDQAAESMGPDFRPMIVAQLTHSGRYSKPDGVARPIIPVRDPYRDPLDPEPMPTISRPSRIADNHPLITDDELDRLQLAYVRAAEMAFEAGFDAVDIKSCHGYLINELLSAHTRSGKYGGPFENRTRFLLEVIDRIHKDLGEVTITTRLGVHDRIPYPYGWAVDREDFTRPDLSEPKRLIGELAQRGVRMVNVTVANPYYNPHVNRPFNEPICGGYNQPEHPLVGVKRMIDLAGEIQKASPDVAIIGSGYSWLRQMMPFAAAASKHHGLATLVGVGRMAFAYPSFAKDILRKGKLDPDRVCLGCSACTQIMRDGGRTGCVVRDAKVYGQIYRRGRMGDREVLLQQASRCRNCADASCSRGCPAGVDIPAFVQAFLSGDDRKAYEIIRQRNVLPEICAWLCPVEDQCEGHCLQNFLGDGALPIAEIQRYVAEQANRNGWSRLRIPKRLTGHRAAIIGAGPAGLSAVAVLLEAGHEVTIFDKGRDLGGLVNAVIPAERQYDSLRHELTAIFADVPGDRLRLRAGVELSEQYTLDDLMKDGFDAAFLGFGLAKSVQSTAERITGLFGATEFLAAARKDALPSLRGKKVAVIGGGNTAIDAAMAARQGGARDVYVLYRRSFEEMPAVPRHRNEAMSAGIHFLILTQQLGYLSKDGSLTGVRVCPVQLGPEDASGRQIPVPMSDCAYNLDMDVVIEAIGQEAVQGLDRMISGVTIRDGLVEVSEDSYQTSRPGVFAGGDLVHGASTVVAAVRDGMRSGQQMDAWMTDGRNQTRKRAAAG